MPNPICEDCKPVEKSAAVMEEIVNDTGCSVLYNVMDKCMKANGGNISSCRAEWSDFRHCFSKNKPQK
jgi:hypothetical protein